MVVPVLPAGCFDAFRMYAAHEGNKPVLKLLSAITEIKEAQEEEESGEPDEDPVEGFEISKAVAEIPVKKEVVEEPQQSFNMCWGRDFRLVQLQLQLPTSNPTEAVYIHI